MQSVREECRERRGASFGEATWQDVRFGLRMLRKNPGFTATAVLILALGIGGNTVVFSIVNGLFIKPLPFPHPERLVNLDETAPKWNLRYTAINYDDFAAWRAHNRTFAGMAMWHGGEFSLATGHTIARLPGQRVTVARALGGRPSILLAEPTVLADPEPQIASWVFGIVAPFERPASQVYKGGIYFGRTCTLLPIQMWDPLVAEALGQPAPTFTGGYVYVECHVPVSEAILGIPASCFCQVTAGVGLGIFYFVEGPTFGARGALEVGGDALCILSLNGRVDMVGRKQGSKFKLNGQGRIAVEIGICPLCLEASKTVKLSTETGGGKAQGGKPNVK